MLGVGFYGSVVVVCMTTSGRRGEGLAVKPGSRASRCARDQNPAVYCVEPR